MNDGVISAKNRYSQLQTVCSANLTKLVLLYAIKTYYLVVSISLRHVPTRVRDQECLRSVPVYVLFCMQKITYYLVVSLSLRPVPPRVRNQVCLRSVPAPEVRDLRNDKHVHVCVRVRACAD